MKGLGTIIGSFILLSILLVGVVSSLEFDNSKSFEKGNLEYGKITITNAFGLGSKLADITLLENSDVCGVPVKECYAKINLTIYEPTLNPISNYKFLDRANRVKGIVYSLQVKTGTEKVSVDDYDYVCVDTGRTEVNGTTIEECDYKVIGSHLESKDTYKNYNTKETLPAGEYIILLTSPSKKWDESVDWQLNFLGSGFSTEWAWWNDGDLSTNLEYYFPMNDSSGSSILDYVNGGQMTWVEGTPKWAEDEYGYGAIELLQSDKLNLASDTSSASLDLREGSWTLGYRMNTTIVPEYMIAWCGMSNSGDANNCYTYMYIDADENLKLASSGGGATGNFGYNPPEGEWHTYIFTRTAGTNTTLFVDGEYITALSGANPNANTDTKNFSWNYRSQDTALAGQTNNFALWSRVLTDSEIITWNLSIVGQNPYVDENYTIKFITYNSTAQETSSESYILGIDYNTTSYVNAEATFYYNGTIYTTTKEAVDESVNFTSTISIPADLNGGSSYTYNFSWQLKLTNPSGISFYFNTTETQQTINAFVLSECNATFPYAYVNFTTYDEITKEPLNSTFQATFNYWIDGGDISIAKNYSFINSTEEGNEFNFCTNDENLRLKVNMNADYGATGYVDKQYFFSQASLSNDTAIVPLYLLNSTDAVKFFFTLTQNIRAVSGGTIDIAKYDSSTGTYTTIGVRNSDEFGKFIEYLELDKQYQFSVSKDGTALGTLYKTSICTTAPCEISLELSTNVSDLWQGYYDIYADNIAYNLSYNSTDKTFYFMFLDMSGLSSEFRLQVDKIGFNGTGNQNICNTTSFSTSGTITCDISAYEGQFTASAYVTQTIEKLIATISATITELGGVLGKEGLFFTLLLLIVVAMVGAFNPVVGIILGIGVFFFSMMMGFLGMSITSIAVILILGLYMVVKMSRGGYGV